ncbi:hypothetical protein Nepgr_012657 [Nepenthes gracilis]|uniref:Uncharacterized protein n=1 Tax=Nepenthes gracilis TaxID=150966 RepID=A0AAD3XNJ9_NEPGR|nr:hypothetical protein Nepgr_012657 [Nepenthes gracilis]
MKRIVKSCQEKIKNKKKFGRSLCLSGLRSAAYQVCFCCVAVLSHKVDRYVFIVAVSADPEHLAEEHDTVSTYMRRNTNQKWPAGSTNPNPNKLVVATLLGLIFVSLPSPG